MCMEGEVGGSESGEKVRLGEVVNMRERRVERRGIGAVKVENGAASNVLERG